MYNPLPKKKIAVNNEHLAKKTLYKKNANKKTCGKNKIRALEKFCKTRKQNTLKNNQKNLAKKTKQDLLKKNCKKTGKFDAKQSKPHAKKKTP